METRKRMEELKQQNSELKQLNSEIKQQNAEVLSFFHTLKKSKPEPVHEEDSTEMDNRIARTISNDRRPSRKRSPALTPPRTQSPRPTHTRKPLTEDPRRNRPVIRDTRRPSSPASLPPKPAPVAPPVRKPMLPIPSPNIPDLDEPSSSELLVVEDPNSTSECDVTSSTDHDLTVELKEEIPVPRVTTADDVRIFDTPMDMASNDSDDPGLAKSENAESIKPKTEAADHGTADTEIIVNGHITVNGDTEHEESGEDPLWNHNKRR